MKLYEKNLIDFEDVDYEIIRSGLADGSIIAEERIKAHHTIPEEEKRPGKTAEQIFNELKENGIAVEIHNGIYCKKIDNTYEAINPIYPIDDWDEYEEIFVKGE